MYIHTLTADDFKKHGKAFKKKQEKKIRISY